MGPDQKTGGRLLRYGQELMIMDIAILFKIFPTLMAHPHIMFC